MNQKPGNTIAILIASILALIFFWTYLYFNRHYFMFYLSMSGIIAGLVNYYYVFLNLPLEPPAGDGDKPKGLLSMPETPFEQPRKTYWLALSGYLVIGIAGSFLTPLINAIIGLKGDIHADHWVLFGYGIVFGFGTNRLLSNILGTVLAKINVSKPATPSPSTPSQNLLLAPPAMTLAKINASDVPTGFDDLLNVPDIDSNFIKGIDISHHNGQITDWQSIKNEGVKFVLIKTSDGVGTPDNMAQTNAILAKNNGLSVGYYHFGRPDKRNGGTVDADARAEANDFFNLLRNLPANDLPLMLDLEDVKVPAWDSPLNPQEYLTWINTFFVELFSLTQQNNQLIYSRKNYLDSKLPANHDLGTRYGLWLSRFNKDFDQAIPANGWADWKIWQFTGDVAMIGDNTHTFDLNLMRIT